MIKFFRKIRYNLMETGKTSKYLKYAIGEIILVVIGILIALQINNWNETRKSQQSVNISIAALLTDLKQDTLQLSREIKGIDEDFDRLNNFRVRLSQPEATIDTLKQIARYEYLPFFDPSNELNRSTITSLLSSGQIENFDDDLKSKILNFNSEQLRTLRIMDQNVTIYLSNQTKYSEVIAVQSNNEALNDYVVKGPLQEQYWQNKTDNELLDAMLTTITAKSIMYSIIKAHKERLKELTEVMISDLTAI